MQFITHIADTSPGKGEEGTEETTPEVRSGTPLGFLRSLLSISPTSEDEQGRSVKRYRRVALTAMTSILSKVIVLATTIISVPLTFHYLGAERYGLWMTITSSVLFSGLRRFRRGEWPCGGGR